MKKQIIIKNQNQQKKLKFIFYKSFKLFKNINFKNFLNYNRKLVKIHD